MKNLQLIETEDLGFVAFNKYRGVYEEFDEEGIFMQTLDNYDSDAEGFKREAAEEKPFDHMSDVGMSFRDFI